MHFFLSVSKKKLSIPFNVFIIILINRCHELSLLRRLSWRFITKFHLGTEVVGLSSTYFPLPLDLNQRLFLNVYSFFSHCFGVFVVVVVVRVDDKFCNKKIKETLSL